MKKAVVLLSGGVDSTTVLAVLKSQGFAPYALTIDFNQRHRIELEAAKRVAKALGVIGHKFVQIDLRVFGGSSLTSDAPVPKDKLGPEIPSTYVPARNTIFLSLALAYAETIGAFDIFYGANAIDYSNYPDCRPEYVRAFEQLANLATAAGVSGNQFHIHTPLLHMTKADIIRKGHELLVDFGMTHSCYDPIGDLACGHCDSCLLRKKGFLESGLPDPTRYDANGCTQTSVCA